MGTKKPSLQAIDDQLQVNVPISEAEAHIEAVAINVATFATEANKSGSYYIVARDIGSAPPSGHIDFAVDGQGNVSSAQMSSIIDNINELWSYVDELWASQAMPGARTEEFKVAKRKMKKPLATLKK